MQPNPLDNVVNIITIAGLAAFTVSGVIVAKRKDMDAFGCMSVAFITALGGGTLRDVLLGRYPLFWIAHEWYAIGLFSVTGATYALEAHTSYIVASILGVITGVFGGVLRDVICNEIPTVFSRTQLYATCALAGVWTYILLDHFNIPSAWSLSAGVAITFLTRMAAVFFDLRLPQELER